METKAKVSLPAFLDLLLDAVFLVDVQGRIVQVSAACERIFGYTAQEMVGQSMIDLVAPEDRAKTLEEARQVMAGRPKIGFENRYIRKDGRLVPIMWSARWSETEQLRIGVARDASERKRAEATQAATYAISEAAHNATDLATLFRDIHQIVAKLVPLAGFAVGIRDPQGGQLGFPYQVDVDPGARGAGGARLEMPLAEHGETIGVMVLESPAGTLYSDPQQELLHFVSAQIATAIKRRQLNDELRRLALYDELTGLSNRRLFQERMKAALARCRRRKTRLALLFVDIDNFKQINDTLGHAAGDALLQTLARRLQDCVREEDTVARLGGDEFVLLLEEIGTPAEAHAMADKIRGALRQPLALGGSILHTEASMGIALYPEHGEDAAQLLEKADARMYQDKKGRQLASVS